MRAGFTIVFIGIGGPQEESLRPCRKVQNARRDLVASVRATRNAGIQPLAGFIIGFDNDGKDIFERQRRFIHDAGVVPAMLGWLRALPGTRLFTRPTGEAASLGGARATPRVRP
ncbi:MAG: hypothetical protein IPJ41_07990 [Phycisphaerales bacterium]|nr:hypothetical protein [Phycisphaerales bacterium]